MVNQYLSHSMPKSAGNLALFLTKSSGNGFNKINGLAKQVLKSPILDSKARGRRGRAVAGRMAGAERYVGRARAAAARFWSQVRACTRTVRRCLGGLSFGGPSWLAVALILTGSAVLGGCPAGPGQGGGPRT